ncbi:hypothetical protein CALCODRAFT_499324 [Calocera cornea HHB12733]|uniref:F-box domain-containing protein n=1 Tax=Calocera cornea HHB12733 TaxID=1353952 RepID=A0A165EHU4_9BASI|nr:hypothetical protein CALCODRAFT_499324 [Calocera cornea HHB12733]
MLPVELVRYIIRLATDVPVAFDTRHESVLDEDRVATRRELLVSLQTKLSISLVSKSFHVLAEEYLYEVLLLTRFPGCSTLRRFAAFLRRGRRGGLRPRGNRVRRLELHFRIDGPWTISWDSLWGLLPACPNVELLLFQPLGTVVHPALRPTTSTYGRYLRHGVECLRFDRNDVFLFTCTEPFVRAVARRYGGTLRRLEVGACCAVRSFYLQLMLAFLYNLEVIHIAPVQWRLGENNDSESIRKKWAETLPIPQQKQQLHTVLLHQACGLEFIPQLCPQLRHVSISNRFFTPFPSIIRNLLQRNAASIISLYYQHYYHSENSLPDIVDLLPNLEHLRLLDWFGASWDNVFSPGIQPRLRTLTLFRIMLSGSDLFKHMRELVQVGQDGRLPKLAKIRLGTCEHNRGGLDQVQPAFARLGITREEREDLRPWYGGFPY